MFLACTSIIQSIHLYDFDPLLVCNWHCCAFGSLSKPLQTNKKSMLQGGSNAILVYYPVFLPAILDWVRVFLIFQLSKMMSIYFHPIEASRRLKKKLHFSSSNAVFNLIDSTFFHNQKGSVFILLPVAQTITTIDHHYPIKQQPHNTTNIFHILKSALLIATAWSSFLPFRSCQWMGMALRC